MIRWHIPEDIKTKTYKQSVLTDRKQERLIVLSRDTIIEQEL